MYLIFYMLGFYSWKFNFINLESTDIKKMSISS